MGGGSLLTSLDCSQAHFLLPMHPFTAIIFVCRSTHDNYNILVQTAEFLGQYPTFCLSLSLLTLACTHPPAPLPMLQYLTVEEECIGVRRGFEGALCMHPSPDVSSCTHAHTPAAMPVTYQPLVFFSLHRDP